MYVLHKPWRQGTRNEQAQHLEITIIAKVFGSQDERWDVEHGQTVEISARVAPAP